MPKKSTTKTKPRAKTTPTKRTEPRPGGAGPMLEAVAPSTLQSSAKKNSALRQANARNAELEAKIQELYQNLTYAEDSWGKAQRIIERLQGQLDNRETPPPRLPDSQEGILAMLRKAPTNWHIRTTVEEAIDVLITRARFAKGGKGRDIPAMRCLGEIAQLFRRDAKMIARRPKKFQEALKHPAFLQALNQPPRKRTRGGTANNDSVQVIYLWTRGVFQKFDELHPWSFMDPDTCIKEFMVFAKEAYEEDDEGGKLRFTCAEILTGLSARTNSGNATAKQSFSYFSPDVKKVVRRIIEEEQRRYPPRE